MAKFRKLFIGGIMGAGLAFALSRREVRKMLMGAGRKALPAAPASSGPSAYDAYKPETTAPAMATSTAPAAEPTTVNEALAEEAAWTEAPPVEVPQVEARPIEMLESEKQEAVAPQAKKPAIEAIAPEALPVERAAADATPAEALIEEPVNPPRIPQMIQEAPYIETVSEAPPEEPVAEIPVAAEPAPEAPVDLLGPAPSTGGSTAEWESLKFPAAGEPTVEEIPAGASETGNAETRAPGPAGIDREEMRRRIDETRSRLKAKAFDAMVSGETFPDETEAEKGEAHAETNSRLEADEEQSLDESLRESD